MKTTMRDEDFGVQGLKVGIGLVCVEETIVQPEIQHRVVGLIQHGGHHAAHVLMEPQHLRSCRSGNPHRSRSCSSTIYKLKCQARKICNSRTRRLE